jgi:hypothetical protein
MVPQVEVEVEEQLDRRVAAPWVSVSGVVEAASAGERTLAPAPALGSGRMADVAEHNVAACCTEEERLLAGLVVQAV